VGRLQREAGHDYTYTVVALYGDPANLEQRSSVEIEIRTETEVGPCTPRSSTAAPSRPRSMRAGSRTSRRTSPAHGAYEWLSRGLLEAFKAFLERAGPGWEVHGAFYEFQWPDALAAIRKAHQRGAKVHVMFDDIVAYDRRGSRRALKNTTRSRRRTSRRSAAAGCTAS
jgi:hypothetical protein